MKEHPILFSAPMVRAILSGQKTQMRRVVKHRSLIEDFRKAPRAIGNEADWGKYLLTDEHGEDFLVKPKYQVGDRLWVKETFLEMTDGSVNGRGTPYVFRSDWAEGGAKDNFRYSSTAKWKPSIFMPRAASRITLEITEIRVERLRDISESDAQAEGAELGQMIGYGAILEKSYREGFLHLWSDINPKTGFDAWVWVITFIRL